MHSQICYESPFLKEAIIRIDFPTPIVEINKKLPPVLVKEIQKIYPIAEPHRGIVQEFQISDKDAHVKKSDHVEWNYYDNDRQRRFTISPICLFVSTLKYKSYEELFTNFRTIASTALEYYSDINASRVGTRYVNVISLDESEPLKWDDYINSKMLCSLSCNDFQRNLTRAFNIVEYNFNGISVKFQYGLANPDYPAIIKRKEFVLDLDAYSNGSFDLNEILRVTEASHGKIQDLFENSITQKTRSLMRPLHAE
jgi:uncharacterized protein (TIGR04255 family)